MDQASKPPRGTGGRFAKGQSGNPSGRPPRSHALVRHDAQRLDTQRLDNWINPATGHGTTRDRRMLTRYAVDIVDDIEAAQLWRSEFLAARIIEALPEEAFRRGWRLKCEDKALAEKICAQAEALDLEGTLIKAAEYERAYGGAAIFPVLSGALGDLAQPLDETAIASVDAFHVLEPQELTPAAYVGDIRSPDFRRPSAYRFTPLNSGRTTFVSAPVIHASRLIIFPGTRVSEQPQHGQRDGWGDSVLCRPRQVISDFGLAWGSAATLLHNHGKETLEMKGLAAMMAQADGLDEFDRHIAAMAMAWSTLRMNVVDSESKISRSTGTLAGIADVLNEFKVLMAAAAEQPVSILMGQSQSGLRTGDDDTGTWYATVERRRTRRYKPRHERAVRLLLLATAGPTNGKEPDVWSIEYPSLWSPSEKEIAETRKTDMDRAVAAVNAGIASADDVAESFYGGDTYSGDIVIDWKRRKAQAEIDAATPDELDDEDLAAMGAEPEGEPPAEEGDPLEGLDDDMTEDELYDSLGEDAEEDDLEDDEDDLEVEDEGEDEDLDDEEDDDRTDSVDRLDKFNPGQARDAKGRFGHGGGGAKSKAKSKGGAKAAGGAAGGGGSAATAKSAARVAKAQARVQKAGARVTAATAGRDKAVASHTAAKAKAAASAAKAEAKPTARNKSAAANAQAKVDRAAAQVGRKEAALAKHTTVHERTKADHAKAEQAHTAHEAKAPAAKPTTAAAATPAAVTKSETPAAKAPKDEAKTTAAVAKPKPAKKAAAPADPHKKQIAELNKMAGIKASSVAGAKIATYVKNGEHAKAAALAEQIGLANGTIKATGTVTTGTAGPIAGKPKTIADHDRDYDAFSAKVTHTERDSLQMYSGSFYSEINGILRGRIKDHPDEESFREHTSNIDSALAKGRTESHTVTYRGVKDFENGPMHKLQPGEIFRDGGYMSTTCVTPKEAGFEGNVTFHITSPAGTRLAAIPSGFKDVEREYLLGRGASLKITKREEVPDGRYGYPSKVTLYATVMHTDPP